MPNRVANDAQVDRLLRALRRADGKPGLSEYGKQLAKKIAKRDKIKIQSAERRLQRLSNASAFESAKTETQRSVRAAARAIPLPSEPARPIEQREVIQARQMPRLSTYRESADSTDLYELRAIIAYFDGDTREAGKALGVDSRLMDLAAQGIEISRAMGRGRIDTGVENLYERLSEDDAQDIQDFSDLLHDLPDWQIGMILDDMADGNTTFADWLDAWHGDDMNIDADEAEYWQLWRAAYARSKA